MMADGSFDLRKDLGTPGTFFPGPRGAILGTYEQVSCSEWGGGGGVTLWVSWCMADENADFWPTGTDRAVTPVRTSTSLHYDTVWLMHRHILGTLPTCSSSPCRKQHNGMTSLQDSISG
jgi:hypothetical protein